MFDPRLCAVCGRKAGVSSFEQDGEGGCASQGIAALPIATHPSSQVNSAPRAHCQRSL